MFFYKPFYRDYNKWLCFIFSYIGAILIIIPKINLVNIAGQTAGLRVDDFLIAFVFILICILIFINEAVYSANGYLYWILAALISFLGSFVTGQPSNILYVIRLVEYYVFFYFGMYAARFFSLKSLCIIILNCNALAILLQFFGLLGGFSSDGYVDHMGRCMGLTAGPWEVGFLLNGLYVILRCYDGRKFSFGFFILFIYTLFFIVLTGARTPLLVHLLLFLFIEYNFTKRKGTVILAAALFLSGILVAFLSIDNQVVERSKNLLSYDNISTMVQYFNTIKISSIFQSFPVIASSGGNTDMSWLIRASHWAVAVKTWMESVFSLFFGVGIGTFGPALDGAWTRIITETGLIGLLSYLYFLYKIFKLNFWTKYLVLAVIINMATIDIHLSYKSMAFALFVVGYLYSSNSVYRFKQGYI